MYGARRNGMYGGFMVSDSVLVARFSQGRRTGGRLPQGCQTLSRERPQDRRVPHGEYRRQKDEGQIRAISRIRRGVILLVG